MRFTKMHGAGNDFVVLDLRDGTPPPDPATCARIADRHVGVGCDQLLTVEPAAGTDAVASYRIWNADGSVSGQCGNGARCIAAWLVRNGAAPAQGEFVIESPAGSHRVHRDAHGGFVIDLGQFGRHEVERNVPRSMAFDDMEEDEFANLFEGITAYIAEKFSHVMLDEVRAEFWEMVNGDRRVA